MAVCRCGKRMPRSVTHCRICEAARRSARFATPSAIVSTGKCPDCGQALRRNNALTGWWQCSGYGAPGFRVDGARECHFQTFTEQ